MFVYNVKINGSKTFKFIFALMIIFLICILGVVIFKVFNGAMNSENTSSCIPQNRVNKITANNYSNVLKAVHENIDDYGVLDLKENQFILARDMIISSDFQSVIVGFLCEYDKALEYEDNSWIEITGEIIKGDYHGDMPIVKITSINKTNKPNDEYVYPPDESYIPTAGIL